MPEEYITGKDGMKIRKLTELRTETAKDYEAAMLSRVEEFKGQNKEKSQFNDLFQNVFVNVFSSLLDLKLQVEKSIGEGNLKKANKTIEQLLLFGI